MACEPCVEENINYCTDECVEKINSKCVTYSGEDIVNDTMNIQTNDDLNKVITELAKNSLDIDVILSFNSTTRQLCLVKNGVSVSCKTIPDGDDQFLELDGTELKIFKPGTVPVQIGDAVDLGPLLSDVQFSPVSQSIQIISGGVKGHSPQFNIIPSSDIGNVFKMGSDGKPYVPASAPAITDVVITSVSGLSFTKSFSNGVLTFLPVFDWNYIAGIVCDICSSSCSAPSGLIVEPE